MTARMTLDTARTQEPATSRLKGVKASVFLSALLSGLSLLSLSSAAEAAPFQQYKNGVCTSAKVCTIDFDLVQAGKRLEINNASCYLRVSGNVELYAMQILVMQGTTTRSALTLVPRFTDSVSATDEVVYSANHPVFAFANASQRLQAYVEVKKGTYSQFACHISGELKP